MNKLFLTALCFSLVFGVSNSIKANDTFDDNNDISKTCGINENLELVESYVNENGEQVDKFSDNSSTIYHNDGKISLYVPADVALTFDSSRWIGWLALGKIVLDIASGVITVCTVIEYATDVNPCDIAVDYLKNLPNKPRVTYDINGIYHEGYIPGCEPSHSLGCNQGYWEYEFVQV